METAIKITTSESSIARLSVVASGPAEQRARTAVEQLIVRSNGEKIRVIGFFSTEKFRRAFREAFEELASSADRLIIENTRSRRLRELEDVARRAWLYGRLGATAIIIEAGRDETAQAVVRHLGHVVTAHNVPVMLVSGEKLEGELLNGWQMAYLCRQPDVNPSAFSPDLIERIPIDTGQVSEPGKLFELSPRPDTVSDGTGRLALSGGQLPQLGLGF